MDGRFERPGGILAILSSWISGILFFCILQKKLLQASRPNSLQLSRTCASWVGRCPGHVATCKVVIATSWARASAATGPDSLELEVENLMEEEFKRRADPWQVSW